MVKATTLDPFERYKTTAMVKVVIFDRYKWVFNYRFFTRLRFCGVSKVLIVLDWWEVSLGK